MYATEQPKPSNIVQIKLPCFIILPRILQLEQTLSRVVSEFDSSVVVLSHFYVNFAHSAEKCKSLLI
jgi:hypothetical protein